MSCDRTSDRTNHIGLDATTDASLPKSGVGAPAPAPLPETAAAPISSCTATTQGGMNDCALQEAKRAEEDLRKVLDRIRFEHKSDNVFIRRFDLAQDAWHKFREAELNATYAHSDDNTPRFAYGSMFGMCINTDRAAMTRERIDALQPWLVGVPPQDACKGEYPEGNPGIYPFGRTCR